MKLPLPEHPCLSCGESKAAVTGLCRRCYSKIRYCAKRACLSADSYAETLEVEVAKTTIGDIMFCDRCNILMKPGSIVSQAYERHEVPLRMHVCPSCGIATYTSANVVERKVFHNSHGIQKRIP